MPALPAPATRWSPLLPVALIVGLLAVLPSGLLGQPTLRAASPHAATAPAFVPTYREVDSHPVAFRRGFRPNGMASAIQEVPRRKSAVALGILLASAGSAGGLIVGARVGDSMSSGDDYLGGLMGAALGAWLGAATGSAAAGGDFGRSLAGSAAGIMFAVSLTPVASGNGPVLVVSHGFTTAMAGR